MAAIQAYAGLHGVAIVETFSDAAVSRRPTRCTSAMASPRCWRGFECNGVRMIIVESPDRFARDLMVQMVGHDLLKQRGVDLLAASAPTHFLEDMLSAELFRQMMGPRVTPGYLSLQSRPVRVSNCTRPRSMRAGTRGSRQV